MFEFLALLFDPTGFPPRWRCGVWTPGHGWLHILSDLGVWAAYFTIPLVLVYIARRRPDMPFRHLFWLFGAFILACGLTHLMDAAVFWWPAYRLAAVLKLFTAVVSWVTVFALLPVIPKALQLRGPAELERQVRARTEELAAANAALHAERERFRATLASIGDAVIATDPVGRVTFLNPVAEALTGWAAERAGGRPLTEVFRIVNEETRATVESPTVRALRDGTVVGLANHTVLLARDGTERPIDDCAAPIRDQGGAVAGAVLVFRDVTDHRLAEAELRASETRYRRLFEANPHPMWVYDRETLRFLAVNAAAEAKYGYSRAEFLGMGIKDIRPPEDVPTLLASLAADTDGLDDAGVWRHQAKDGRLMRVRITGHTFGFDGRPAELVLAHDVTAQLAAEEQLRDSEERLRQALTAGGMGAFDMDLTSGRVQWSEHMYVLFGYADDRPDPVEFRHFRDRVHPDDWPAVEARRAAARADDRPYSHEYRVQRPDGTVRWVAGTGRYSFDAGRAVRLTGVIQDITARKQAADALAESNRLYVLLADHSRDVVMLFSPARRVLYASPSCERLTGYPADALVGRDRTELVHPDDRPAMDHGWAEAAGGRPTTVEWRCQHRDGRPVWVETLLTPLPDGSAVVSTSRDVTVRRAAEERLRQAQKMEAVGHLAGGVAHDFNNLLTVVNGCGEMLRDLVPADGPAGGLVDDICRAGDRGAALTRQLLAFSRQQMLRVEPFDPNRVTRETAALLRRLIGEDISLSLHLDPAAGHLRADPDQFSQILVNLAVNARDAMPTGGTLTVETAAVELTAADTLPAVPDARPGRFVRLTVRDTGEGMPPAVLARQFEPFFTTKPAGKGTGLGLATVYGIVRQSGGFVTVRSEVGRGSSFAVHLPRYDPSPLPMAPAPAADIRSGGRETVLVVEDDPAVRTLTTIVLERHGYRVVTADGGAAALAVCDALPAPPDLVLTDVVMPGMSGRELAEALGTRYPRLKVVFLSGYTADAVLRHRVEQARVAFLQKPYTPNALTRFVREVLDTPPG